MGKISLEVNGRKVEKEAPDNTLLSTFLREHLQLTGTHIGCDTSQCGLLYAKQGTHETKTTN